MDALPADVYEPLTTHVAVGGQSNTPQVEAKFRKAVVLLQRNWSLIELAVESTRGDIGPSRATVIRRLRSAVFGRGFTGIDLWLNLFRTGRAAEASVNTSADRIFEFERARTIDFNADGALGRVIRKTDYVSQSEADQQIISLAFTTFHEMLHIARVKVALLPAEAPHSPHVAGECDLVYLIGGVFEYLVMTVLCRFTACGHVCRVANDDMEGTAPLTDALLARSVRPSPTKGNPGCNPFYIGDGPHEIVAEGDQMSQYSYPCRGPFENRR